MYNVSLLLVCTDVTFLQPKVRIVTDSFVLVLLHVICTCTSPCHVSRICYSQLIAPLNKTAAFYAREIE